MSVLGAQDDVVRHMPALPHREVGAALRKVWASNSAPVSLLAFEFLVLVEFPGLGRRGDGSSA